MEGGVEHGDVLEGVLRGEQGMPGGCAPWRDMLGAGDAPGAVLRGRSCGAQGILWELCSLGCVGCFGVHREPWGLRCVERHMCGECCDSRRGAGDARGL